jgi:DNA modification methylase
VSGQVVAALPQQITLGGSATSIVAAEEIGRRCFAMELMPAYVDVALRR